MLENIKNMLFYQQSKWNIFLNGNYHLSTLCRKCGEVTTYRQYSLRHCVVNSFLAR